MHGLHHTEPRLSDVLVALRFIPVKMTGHIVVWVLGIWRRGVERRARMRHNRPTPSRRAAEEDGMVTPQQPVEVEVFGQRFALRSEKSAEEVRQIAAYVDHQFRQVAEQARTPV